MNYIQVELGGRAWGLKFLQGALIIMQEKSASNDAFSIYAIVWAGLVTNAYVKETELGYNETVAGKEKFIPITFEQACDWVDELPLSEQQNIVNEFSKTTLFQKAINNKEEKTTEEDLKKNVEVIEPTVSELQEN